MAGEQESSSIHTDEGRTRSRERLHACAMACGLGCLLATLLIYTSAVTPFQRFTNAAEFVGQVTHVALQAALVASAVVALARVLTLRRAAPRWWDSARCSGVLSLVGGLLYVGGCLSFCAIGLEWLPVSTGEMPVGIVLGLGCVAELFSWGRALREFSLTQATTLTCLAAIIAAALGALLEVVPVGAIAPVFCALAVAACAVPAVVAWRELSQGAPSSIPVGELDQNARSALRDLASIAAVPAIGLILFAMIMAARAERFAQDFTVYGVTQCVIAALLLVVVLVPQCRRLVHMAYRSLIPVLAVAAVSASYISQVAWGGSPFELVCIFLLYSAAAILTVATLIGIMHAAEFSSDLVVALAVLLFCAATLLSGRIMRGLDPAGIRTFVSCATALYAVGMTAYSLARAERTVSGVGEVESATDRRNGAVVELPASREAVDGEASDSELPTPTPSLDARCDAVAAACGLTPREREVLQILAQGHNAVYVSETLLISPNTARTHVHNIYRKLDISSREELLARVNSAVQV